MKETEIKPLNKNPVERPVGTKVSYEVMSWVLGCRVQVG